MIPSCRLLAFNVGERELRKCSGGCFATTITCEYLGNPCRLAFAACSGDCAVLLVFAGFAELFEVLTESPFCAPALRGASDAIRPNGPISTFEDTAARFDATNVGSRDHIAVSWLISELASRRIKPQRSKDKLLTGRAGAPPTD
jgi:hypothetical protein